MAITNVNTTIAKGTPHHDDFDESKNYHRILFRPGHAVQARELTQLQTALQAQIDKLGQYAFKDGDRVLGGKLSLNTTSYAYIKLESTHSGSAISSYISDFLNTTITGATSGVTAKVIGVTVAASGDPDTLYLQYTNSGTNKATSVLAAGEVIASNGSPSRSATLGGGSGSGIANPVGLGSSVAIEEGVYFISGTFVHVPAETLLLDKFTNTPTYIIGLQVSETIKSTLDAGYGDLNDNATGTTNFTAPGANRYVIDTTLIKEPIALSSRAVAEYIHLMTIEGGVVFTQPQPSVDTELSTKLERRTKEESGDYVLSPFQLDIKQHLNDAAGNGGYLTAGQGGDATKIAIGVEPSVAYIQGRRIEKVATEHVVVDKTRGASDLSALNTTVQSLGFGNYIKLDPAECEGIPDINTLDTFELRNSGGTKIGTARARGLEHDTASPAHFRLYIFDVTMNASQAFGSVQKIGKSGLFEANLLSTALGKRFDAGQNSLVFKLPADAISTLKNGANHTADYNTRVKLSASGAVSSGAATFSIPGSNTLANDDDVIIHAGALADNQDAIPVADSQVAGVGSGSMTLSGLSAYDGDTIFAVATVKVTNGQAKTKAPTNSTATITYSASTSTYDLGEVDIRSITSIVDAASENVTNKFILDNGQRDSFYDTGKVILKGGETLAAGNFVVTFTCFRHEGSGDYFSVDSYGQIAYEDIPSYQGVELRDCVDFRPTKARTGASAGAEFSAGTGSIVSKAIQPVGTVSLDFKHYLSRIDKLFLTKTGKYRLVKGTSDLFPTEPEGIEDSIHLYNVFLRPYVFNTGDVKVKKIDNKRYTMRDIGTLDKRIKTLEYYTSLSLLEKSANDAQILDSSGDLRFKNGFIVDGFYGHGVGDTSHPDYSVAIDKTNGILRPSFDERNINLVRKTGEESATMAAAISAGNAVKSTAGGIVTMPYNIVTELNQPYSSFSEFVNPYNVTVWDGTVKLSPESDEWKETDIRPDIIIDDNEAYNQFVNMAESEGILGTVWNEWETNWTGREIGAVTTSRSRDDEDRPRLTGVDFVNGRPRSATQTTTTAITTTGTRARDGIESYVTSDTETKEIGNVIIETNFIPFMRSREIFFDAQLLKPTTTLYAFFNGVDITTYCKQKSFVEFSADSSINTFEGVTSHPDASSGALESDASGRVTGSFIIPRNAVLKFKTGTREFKLTDSSTNADTATTSAIENFYAQGVLEVHQKTIVSTKVPRIARREVSESEAITEQTTESRHERIRWADPLAESLVIKQEGGIFTTSVDIFFAAKDTALPVLISLREVENGIPTQRIVPGAEKILYPSDVNLPSDMSANSGVGNADTATAVNWDFPVYLKEGAEYAIVLISNSDVYKVYVAETSKLDLTSSTFRITKQPFNGVFFTSQNASTWTPEQNKDLKFALKRASFQGSSATVNLVNDVIPAKKLPINPFVFESHPSGSTCKVRVLHRNHGMYGADGSHSVTIANVTGTNNGVANTALNGNHTVNAAELDSYVITITAQATTLGVRSGGGTAGSPVTATENQMYDTLKINAATLEFPGRTDSDPDVGIAYAHTGFTTKSQDGDSDTGQLIYTQSSAKSVLANKNITFDRPFSVISSRNKTFKNITVDSFNLLCTLSNGGKENLSPVIDLNRTSLFTIQNRINDATTGITRYQTRGTHVVETNGTGTSNLAKYITRQVNLNTDASVLDVYINANQPKNTAIDVFYKATDNTDIDFDDIAWVALTPEETIPTNNSGRYSEVHYSTSTVGLQTFNSFSIKVVLRSTRSTDIPTVKDFRAIATT